jgi:hypothetical protein
MMEFKTFLEETEEKKNISSTLKKIPMAHRSLVKDFKYTLQPKNTMNDDGENIGEVDPRNKKITIAAPWNYGREFTMLHEIGHMVWATLDNMQKKKWSELVKKIKNDPKRESQDQCKEELFCMAYANTYANHKDKIHDHPEWEKFVKSI